MVYRCSRSDRFRASQRYSICRQVSRNRVYGRPSSRGSLFGDSIASPSTGLQLPAFWLCVAFSKACGSLSVYVEATFSRRTRWIGPKKRTLLSKSSSGFVSPSVRGEKTRSQRANLSVNVQVSRQRVRSLIFLILVQSVSFVLRAELDWTRNQSLLFRFVISIMTTGSSTKRHQTCRSSSHGVSPSPGKILIIPLLVKTTGSISPGL